ncbi:MAG: type II toxin-antitoxin system RatA family toxin [Novosphingobium sp.]|nr:type II toxin-antitoxin system RatA family toxin [Novosphingobium sp.]
MPKFETTRLVRHTPENMFSLVADVEKYPEFLPLCEALKVTSRRERDGKTLLVADMTVGYKAIRETFTSQVMLDPAALRIDVQYLDGPFRYLNNIWTFRLSESGCDVGFFIDYEFRSRMLGMVMGSMFDIAFRKFSQAFEERADLVFGSGSSTG